MPVELWTSESFLVDVTCWVAAEAHRAGLRLDGSRDQPHARPWSSAIVFGTDAGRIWFKVNGPGTTYEAGVVAILNRHTPDLVPRLIAVDTARGWSLSHDAGPTLRSTGAPDQLWDRWIDVLQRYGAAQRALAAYVHELAGTGIRDLGPGAVPGALRRLVDELAMTAPEHGGLDPRDAERLRAAYPDVEAWCAELAASALPVTLNHDDLHSNNVCVSDGGARIIDWGDSCLSHPFGTLLATVNSIARHASCRRDDARVRRVVDAYLEVFAGYGDRASARRWASAARRVDTLARALSYVNAFAGEPLSAQAEADWPVRSWLLELLDPAVG